MTFFWLLFSGCVLSAALFGYGLGYLNGARDTINANVADGARRGTGLPTEDIGVRGKRRLGDPKDEPSGGGALSRRLARRQAQA
jgi:hypothetical protein